MDYLAIIVFNEETEQSSIQVYRETSLKQELGPFDLRILDMKAINEDNKIVFADDSLKLHVIDIN